MKEYKNNEEIKIHPDTLLQLESFEKQIQIIVKGLNEIVDLNLKFEEENNYKNQNKNDEKGDNIEVDDNKEEPLEGKKYYIE